MSCFDYTVLDNGARQSGVIEASNQSEAATRLRQGGKVILSLTPSAKGVKGTGKKSPGGLPKKLSSLFISKAAMELALRQLASLLQAGVPILTAIRSIAVYAPKLLGQALEEIAESIRHGHSLSKSVDESLPSLGRVTIGLISVGEANGTIDQMADYSADLMERSRRIRNQITQAFAYPVVVMLIAMGIGYYMVNNVFPVVMKFLEKSRSSAVLPLPTRMVIWLNDFLLAYGLFIFMAPFVLVALVILLRRNFDTGEMIDRLSLRIPLLGGAFIFHANTMWCLTLGALLRSGLDVVSAVDLVERTMGNWHYAAQFRKIREMLRQGSSLGKSISSTSLKNLSPMAHTMVSVSENSGGLDESLMHVAAYSEEQLNRRVALLSKMVEPAVFVVVGGMVGLVYFGFFMAMLTATKAAH